ncbi:MAG: hypothetical protein ACLFWL_18325 [Candidatus Brocadiia bacterium]
MSRTVAYMIELLVASGDAAVSGSAARSYEVGVVQSIPLPPELSDKGKDIGPIVREVWREFRAQDTERETSKCYMMPIILKADRESTGGSLIDLAQDAKHQSETRALSILALTGTIERKVQDLYGLNESTISSIQQEMGKHPWMFPEKPLAPEEMNELAKLYEEPVRDIIELEVNDSGGSRAVTKKSFFADRKLELLCYRFGAHPKTIIEARREMDVLDPQEVEQWISELISYAAGVGFGRWDIRIALGEAPKVADNYDPFTPVPSVAPAELQFSEQSEPLQEYPVKIAAGGVLVDDPGHPQDILRRIQEVFRTLWGEVNGDKRYREAIEIIDEGADSLRNYFRKKGNTGFFLQHVKRYSKSRRNAPIYWQLATPSVSYAVWLYYHRFTRDTMYKVQNDYVEPKLQHEERRLNEMRSALGSDASSRERKEVEEQEEFVEELRQFRDEVARVAPLWNPNLNDGVIINYAPLWRLVAPRKWQKRCKKTWGKLVDGEYDWAHLAMHLWPERVVPKCADRRDLAIAHDLEEVFWEETEDGDWEPRDVSDEKINELIDERTSTAVKAALEDLLSAPAV